MEFKGAVQMAKKKPGKPISEKSVAQKRSAVRSSHATQVVAKPPSSDRPEKGPDGLTYEQRIKRIGESKDNLRISSYHEAGHAVWEFLDGRLDSIKRVRIAYSDGTTGECHFSYGSYATKHSLPVRRSTCQLAASHIALNFSGPVCQYICTKRSDSWNRMLDEWFESDDYEAGQSTREWKSDFQYALEIALSHLGLAHRRFDSAGEEPMALLETVWRWTWEVFAEPRVWKVVNTLAKALIAQAPGTMWGKTIQPMIRDSWKGPQNQVPMAYLGEPYVSRFGIEAGVYRPF
jgi:hypothetical protein